jgi:hypothetical protein
VSGSVVVGQMGSSSGPYTRAFAFDLAKPSEGMIDLGLLSGGTSSAATGVSGHTVVGSANKSGTSGQAMTYDLSNPAAGKRSIGNGNAMAISDETVVGMARYGTAFAYDLSQPGAGFTDLGTVGEAYTHSRPDGISGDIAVGVSFGADMPDMATVWTRS